MKIYVLKQLGFGAIAYNQNKDVIVARLNEESDNGRFAGFEIKEVEIPEGMFELNSVDFWNYLRKA